MNQFVIDADEGYVPPTIPDAQLTLGGKVYRLSSPEPKVWATVVGLEENTEENAFSFLKATMADGDFDELRGRVYDAKDDSVDVFKVIRATAMVGQAYGEIVSEHFQNLDGLGTGNRAQRRAAAQAPARSVPARKTVPARGRR